MENLDPGFGIDEHSEGEEQTDDTVSNSDDWVHDGNKEGSGDVDGARNNAEVSMDSITGGDTCAIMETMNATPLDLIHNTSDWNYVSKIEICKRQLHHPREKVTKPRWSISLIVAKPPPPMAAVLPWNRENGIHGKIPLVAESIAIGALRKGTIWTVLLSPLESLSVKLDETVEVYVGDEATTSLPTAINNDIASREEVGINIRSGGGKLKARVERKFSHADETTIAIDALFQVDGAPLFPDSLSGDWPPLYEGKRAIEIGNNLLKLVLLSRLSLVLQGQPINVKFELDFLLPKLNYFVWVISEPNWPIVVTVDDSKVSSKNGVLEYLIKEGDTFVLGAAFNTDVKDYVKLLKVTWQRFEYPIDALLDVLSKHRDKYHKLLLSNYEKQISEALAKYKFEWMLVKKKYEYSIDVLSFQIQYLHIIPSLSHVSPIWTTVPNLCCIVGSFVEDYVSLMSYGGIEKDVNVTEEAIERGSINVESEVIRGNHHFWRIYKVLGVDVMGMCINLFWGQAFEWALLEHHSFEGLFGVQIYGVFVDTIAWAVELIAHGSNNDLVSPIKFWNPRGIYLVYYEI
ncbi:hypothetical protein PIB30_022945 [Stylosanthes scabra]|uniref:Exocyst complex subunit EXOC6/Sec15 C-terminal domain-containing protein n=1 Tax=Stylosanthes scabra TaxID=79078 RepID=A0ABU6R9T3_9FABA|nr:hypothetical protein [Stylosanthes scabra]